MKLFYRYSRGILIFSVVIFILCWKLNHHTEPVEVPFQESKLTSSSQGFTSTKTASVVQQVSKSPNLSLLLELDIIKQVVVDNRVCLPVQLLQDDLVVQRIEQDNQHNTEVFYKEIFREWLGSSRPATCTWRTLIRVLRKCKLNTAAADLTNSVSEEVLDVEPLPYSHSLEI